MFDNNTDGAGDPYWYEWSVGLKYAIKMFNPDNGIKHIKLQSPESKSLDDVVVEYESGKIQCIQVKHTREEATLTFASLTQASDKKASVLQKLSRDWKILNKKYNNEVEVIVFTNKSCGDRKYKEYPPLKNFYNHMKDESERAKAIDEITMLSEHDPKFNYEAGWDIWKKEISVLDKQEKLEFIRCFSILAEQESLAEMGESIAKDLSECFSASLALSEKLHSYLCRALMEWSTTIREKEEITKEDVMRVLSLTGDEIVGVHHFPICEPFFSSRIEFVERLEDVILNGSSNVTFLEGEPGSGKSNIVNYLALKPDSVVTVRFHVFKPILAGDIELSADKGITSSRHFWGNLLIMLRKLFIDRLYEYKVPISIELIDSVEKLKSEVMRLAKVLSDITEKETIIVVDGIDHAARSGDEVTFLSTLPYGEAVPKGVKFLIVGQPVQQYPQYPDFLANANLVNKVCVPSVDRCDIELLYNSKTEYMQYTETDKALIIDYITSKCQGNTLSVVFALEEATKYNDFSDYEKNSGVTRLANGVHSYYSYIWETSLSNCRDNSFQIDMRMVAIFSMINKGCKSVDIATAFENMGLRSYEWKDILDNLFPIIICKDGVYKVFHNDVRVFLKNRYSNASLSNTNEIISGEIADFLIEGGFDSKIKHELIFTLLESANRKSEYIDIFDYSYVLESFAMKRPFSEIREQLDLTLGILKTIEQKYKIVKLYSAIATIYQFKQSLEWHELEYDYEISVPFALPCERYTVASQSINKSEIDNLLNDIQLLDYAREHERAEKMLKRWIDGMSFKEICIILEQAECSVAEIENIAKTLGKYMRRYNPISQFCNSENKKYNMAFCESWLKESEDLIGEDKIEVTLKGLYCFAIKDFNNFYIYGLENWSLDDIKYLFLRAKEHDILSIENKIKTALIAIKENDTEFIKDIISEVQKERFSLVESIGYYSAKYEHNQFGIKLNTLIDISNILILTCNMTFDQVMYSAMGCLDQKKDSSEYKCAVKSLYISCYVAELKISKCLDSEYESFKQNIKLLLKSSHWRGMYHININTFRKEVIGWLISFCDKLPVNFQNDFLEVIVNKAREGDEYYLLDCYWEFLLDKNNINLVEKYIDDFLTPTSELWAMDLGEKKSVAEVFLSICVKMNWYDKIGRIKQIGENTLITYVDRKDYSLSLAYQLYEEIASLNTSIWRDLGIKLLNVSEYASKIGDNRYYVDIKGAVTDSVGRDSLSSIMEFMDTTDSLKDEWFESIFDSIISALQCIDITEEDLIEIWDIASSIFYVYEEDRYERNNMRNKIYIADIHKTIKLCAIRLGYLEIENKMAELSPDEFAQERLGRESHSYIIPKRWFDTHHTSDIIDFIETTKSMNYKERYSYIKDLFENEGKISWRCLSYVVEEIKSHSIKYLLQIMPEILTMLQSRPFEKALYYDGSQELYYHIIEYLSDDDINILIERVLKTYSLNSMRKLDYGEYNLLHDITDISLCILSKAKVSEAIEALNLVIEMHYSWILGSNYDIENRHKYYIVENQRTKTTTWDFICSKIREKHEL